MKLILEIGDVVVHRVGIADEKWSIGVIIGYRTIEGLYEVKWGDGQTRNHTRELLKHIA